MNLSVAENTKTFAAPPPKNGGREIYYPESDGKPMGETEYHIKTIIALYQALDIFFKNRPDVRIFSDIMFYYESGEPRKVLSPDVMVVRGVGRHLRRTFKLWEEKVPDVIFEISSRGTWKEDLQKKYQLYEGFGVKEYYVFDPEYDYLKDEPLIAYHLLDGSFQEMKVKRGRIFSPALGLEIVDTGETLRLSDPETKSFLPTIQELESEVEKLRAEVAKLKRQS